MMRQKDIRQSEAFAIRIEQYKAKVEAERRGKIFQAFSDLMKWGRKQGFNV